jgi:parallel beta-helix repeat protein
MISVERVDGVTVRGFKVLTRTDGPCDDVDVAILVTGSRRTQIRGNRVLAPGSGASSSSCEMGLGIAVADFAFDSSDPRSASALVAFNEVRDAAFGGIVGIGQTRMVTVNAIHNSVRAYFHQAPSGPPIEGLSGGGEFGVALLGRVQGEISDNVVQGATSAFQGGGLWFFGIIAGDQFVMTPGDNGSIDIEDNIVRRVGYGIGIVGADQVSVRRNQATNTYYGVIVSQTTNSQVRRNTIASKAIGLWVEGSAGNDLVSNAVSGNGGVCVDDSSGGSGTAGTTNQWVGNTATVGSSPVGICETPAP